MPQYVDTMKKKGKRSRRNCGRDILVGEVEEREKAEEQITSSRRTCRHCRGRGEEMTGCRRRQRHCRAVLGKIEGLGHRHSLA